MPDSRGKRLVELRITREEMVGWDTKFPKLKIMDCLAEAGFSSTDTIQYFVEPDGTYVYRQEVKEVENEQGSN